MDKNQQAAVIFELTENLRKNGSWCGETHVQKATYLIKELCGVPIGFDFVLYMYGPFSFDLRDALTGYRAYNLLGLEVEPPYGPRLKVTPLGRDLMRRYPHTLGKYREHIHLVTENLGSKGVGDLECLATALYVTRKYPGLRTKKDRARELQGTKPHIQGPAARLAIEEVDRLIRSCPVQGSAILPK
jgi:hypothetical protein